MRSATTICCLLLSSRSAGAFTAGHRGDGRVATQSRSSTAEDPTALAATGGDSDGCPPQGGQQTASARREFLSNSLAAASLTCASLLADPPAAHAADEPGGLYRDEDFNFQISVPKSWEVSEQQLSGRRKGVFFVDPDSKSSQDGTVETLGFIAYTPLRDDFTSLGSFGSVDTVAQTTILPKGELAGGDTGSSRMLSAVKDGNAYVFDYVATPVVPTETGPKMTKELKTQHFRTIFTLLPFKDNAGLTLVTITIQTTEDRYDGATRKMFDGIIGSFGKIS